MTKNKNIAVIGLGNMGRHHARIYNEIPSANLVAVCDIQETLVKDHQEKYNCQGYTDIEKMLNECQIDAVSIAAPSCFHFEIAKLLINKGIHVLIEKPITDSTDSALKLIELAQKKNIVLTVGHIERFNPAVLKLKELLAKGELGEIISVSTQRISPFPNQIKDADVLIDLAVHDIDIISYLFGRQPDEVTVNTGKALNNLQNDYAGLLLKYGDRHGFAEVSWIAPIKVRSLKMIATKGYVELDYMNQELTVHYSSYSNVVDSNNASSIIFEPVKTEKINIKKQNMLQTELENFLNSIHTNTQPFVSAQQAYNALKIALEA
ncbi:Gfo/Idh/MocA family oxidoreductase [Candidatus Margulisiibacteriota bacterium]